MSAGERSIDGILDVIMEQAEPPWYQLPSHVDIKHLPAWRAACNEVATLAGEPLPYPPPPVDKVEAVRVSQRAPSFPFKDTKRELEQAFDQLRGVLVMDVTPDEDPLTNLRTLLTAYDMDSRIPDTVSNLDKDMAKGKPFVPRDLNLRTSMQSPTAGTVSFDMQALMEIPVHQLVDNKSSE